MIYNKEDTGPKSKFCWTRILQGNSNSLVFSWVGGGVTDVERDSKSGGLPMALDHPGTCTLGLDMSVTYDRPILIPDPRGVFYTFL